MQEKKIVVFSFFFQFFFWIWLSWFFVWTQSNFSSAWHDNQFFFFFYSFIFFEWSTLGNVACRGWPSSLKHLFSYEDHFERVGFWFEVARIIFAHKKDMAQKYFREMANFQSMCSEASIKVISERHDLETCVFGHWKGLAGLKL